MFYIKFAAESVIISMGCSKTDVDTKLPMLVYCRPTGSPGTNCNEIRTEMHLKMPHTKDHFNPGSVCISYFTIVGQYSVIGSQV